MSECRHLNLYPDVNLQLKMAHCGHFLLHGQWECQGCGCWIMIECEDEWDGQEGVTSIDRQYQYQKINGRNKVVNRGLRERAIIQTGEPP